MEETALPCFDDFLIPRLVEEKNEEKKETLIERCERERLEWTNKIKEMSNKMKDIFRVSAELMTEIYTERQRAVEYYHYLISILSKINKKYRIQWVQKYDHYSYKSQKRFPNEKTKEMQILSEMGEILDTREIIDNHSKFINSTISTLDNIIYGIKYKVEIENISRGK